MVDRSLLSLARGALEESKHIGVLVQRWQFALLLLATATLFVPSGWAYGLSVLVVVIQCRVWWLIRQRDALKATGEAGKRRALLLSALGPTSERLDAADLRAQLTAWPRVVAKAASLDDPDYYASAEPLGTSRLLDCIQESAFYSQHLYAAAAGRAIKGLVVVVIVFTIAVLCALPTVQASSEALLLARGLVVILSTLVGLDALGKVLAWKDAARLMEIVDRRIEAMRPHDREASMAIFADYSVATSSAPLIPTPVHEAERDRLEKLWAARNGEAQ